MCINDYEYLRTFMKKINFPEDAVSFFLGLYNRLSDEEICEIRKWESVYFMDESDDKTSDEVNKLVYNSLKAFSADYGYDYHAIQMLFLLFCSAELHCRYSKKGLGDDLYYAMMNDLTYKVIECKKFEGIWGTMSFSWMHRHFLMTRFALGRFQYEEYEFIRDSYDFGDVHLKKGDRVINMHIPSSGPMTDEMRLESYKKAYEFFRRDDEKYVVFVCHSWLLYPEGVNIYPQNSNLYKFLKEFDIIHSHVHPVLPFPNSWRVFYKDYMGDTSILPQNTTLEKNIVKWLDSGGKIGDGYGVMIFDGEKAINI